jgi:cytochrome c biogenesis protein
MTDTLAPLSTTPESRAPGPARRNPLVAAWRQLTSMRTALILLFLLALAAVPGSLLPQRGLNPTKVVDFHRAHPQLFGLLDRLSLFDVFASPWFAAVYLLLFISLIGCVVPRLAMHARALRARPPRAPRNLDRLPLHETWTTPLAPADAIATARGRLRRWRVDVRDDGSGAVTLSAERGYLRETGNLLFHLALIVLLAGVAAGGLFGYKGTVLLVNGDGFSNTRNAYDSFHPSRLFRDSELAPFSFTLERFHATYQPNGQPTSFEARVLYQPRPGAPERAKTVRVNSPLDVGGAKVYLVGHGYAPHFVVRDGNGQIAYDAATPFIPDNGMFVSHGVVKAPDARPQQLGFSGFFFPTVATSPRGLVSTFPDLRKPAVALLAWRGDLGLDNGIPQSVYALDIRKLKRVQSFALTPGMSQKLPGGGSITFTGVDQWATFQVAHDPGKAPALAAAVLIVIGLLLSLRVRRRRVWVRAATDGDGRTVVEAGGLARTDADDFAADFRELASRLRDPKE